MAGRPAMLPAIPVDRIAASAPAVVSLISERWMLLILVDIEKSLRDGNLNSWIKRLKMLAIIANPKQTKTAMPMEIPH